MNEGLLLPLPTKWQHNAYAAIITLKFTLIRQNVAAAQAFKNPIIPAAQNVCVATTTSLLDG